MPWIQKNNSAKPWTLEWIYRTNSVEEEHTWHPPSLKDNIILSLPNELLERIMRHCENAPSHDPHSRYYMHDLCAMARVCRVFHRATTPILYSGFKSYHAVEWESHNLTDKRPALLLRTLLEKPELGRYFNIIELTEKYIGGHWIDPENRRNCGVDMSLFKKRTKAGRKAYDRLSAKVRMLCALPIWRFPAGQRTSWRSWGLFPDTVRVGEKGADHSSQPALASYNEAEFRKGWMRALMHGQYDAVYALLLCLTTEIQTLQINAWMVNWSKLEPRGSPPQGLVVDFLSQLMRAAAVSQQDGVDEPILPKLNHIKLYSYAEEADKPIALAIPYLLQPSVSEATLSGLWDAQWFANLTGPDGARPSKANEKEDPQYPPKLSLPFTLKKLRIRNSMLHPHSLGKLLTCCEGLEWLSYSQYKQILADERLVNADANAQDGTTPEPVEDMDLHIHSLQPYLDKHRKTLRYLDFATNAEEDIRWWDFRTDRPDKWEIWSGFFNLSGFEKLEEVYLLSENLQHWGPQMDAEDYDDFSAVLPLGSLKKLAIHNSLWTREWYGPDLTKETRTRDAEGKLQGYFESRMERYAESFVRLFESNERRRKEGKTFRKVVMEEMVWVGQGDRDGEEAFYGMRFPVVRRLRSLCAKNGISFEFKNAAKDNTGFEQEREIEKEENDHVGRIGYAVFPDIERALEANSQSPELGAIYPGSRYDEIRDEWILADKPMHTVVVKQELDPNCMETVKLWYNPVSGTGSLLQEFYREPQGPVKLTDHMDEDRTTELMEANNREAEEAIELEVAMDYLVSEGKLPENITMQEEGQEDNLDDIRPEEEYLNMQDIVNLLSQTHKPVVRESVQNEYQKDEAGNLFYPPKQKILERDQRVRVRQWNWSEFQVIRCRENGEMREREPTYEEYDEADRALDEQEMRALGNISVGRRTNIIGFRREARAQRRLRREDEVRRREEQQEYQRRRREVDELMNSMPVRGEGREDEDLDDVDGPSSWDGLDDGEDELDEDEDYLESVSRRMSKSQRTRWRKGMKTRMNWRLRLRRMSRGWRHQTRLIRRRGGGVLSRKRRMSRRSMRLIARRLRGRGGDDEDLEMNEDEDKDDEDRDDAPSMDGQELKNQKDEEDGFDDDVEDKVEGASLLVEQELDAAENIISAQSRKRAQRGTEDEGKEGGYENDRSASPRRKRRRIEETEEDAGDGEDNAMESSDGEEGRRELYEDPFQ